MYYFISLCIYTMYTIQQQNLIILDVTSVTAPAVGATNRTMDFIDQKAVLFLDLASGEAKRFKKGGVGFAKK